MKLFGKETEMTPRLFMLGSLSLAALAVLVAMAVFFVSVQGEEQTMVPTVTGKSLTSALLELQVKELYPRLQLRYSNDGPAGTILEQDPPAGAIVKAGRRIRLVVSQGPVVSVVENYIGRDIEEIRLDLQAKAGASSLLAIKEPALSEYSSLPEGTVLQQTPAPLTPVSGHTELQFVVSRGPEPVAVDVPELVGLNPADAAVRLAAARFVFDFTVRPPRGRETAETVVAQDPAPGILAPPGTRVSVESTAPLSLEEGEEYGLFTHTLPLNPYPLPLTLTLLDTEGTQKTLLAINHSGGDFSFPCRKKEGGILILTLQGREMVRKASLEPVTP